MKRWFGSKVKCNQQLERLHAMQSESVLPSVMSATPRALDHAASGLVEQWKNNVLGFEQKAEQARAADMKKLADLVTSSMDEKTQEGHNVIDFFLISMKRAAAAGIKPWATYASPLRRNLTSTDIDHETILWLIEHQDALALELEQRIGVRLTINSAMARAMSVTTGECTAVDVPVLHWTINLNELAKTMATRATDTTSS